MDSHAEIAVGGRAVMRVGRNLVEVRVVGRIEGGWNVVSRTGKTVAARELSAEERGRAPGANLAAMCGFRAKPKADAAPAAKPASAEAMPAEAASPETDDASESVAAETTAEEPNVTEAAAGAMANANDPVPAAPAFAPSGRAVPRKGLSLLSAAAAVLERATAPMSVKAMIETAKASGIWTPGRGRTPSQTLYSAIIREIRDKGDAARFVRAGRGLFAFKS